MNTAARLLTTSDPARHLGPALDERAEAELAALVHSASPHRRVPPRRPMRRSRLQGALVTGLVAVAVVAVSITVVLDGPPSRDAGGSSAAPSRTTTSDAVQRHPRPLIEMDGARVLTRAELHVWTLEHLGDSADAAVGEQEDWLDIECMARKGFVYDPTIEGTFAQQLGRSYGLTPAQREAYDAAFFGSAPPTESKPYDWRTAGCHGRSVHLTGQDGDR